MIQDKDYIIRIVRQFSDFLSGLLLGKNEEERSELDLVFETQMKDVFKMEFADLDQLSSEEILVMVSAKDPAHQLAYTELLGNLIFYKFQQDRSVSRAQKAQLFYERWLQESKIFSLPVISRIGEVKKYLEEV